MNSGPLVSVICLCHNQKNFVKSALESVRLQTYKNIELIVVDDGSVDGSKEIIKNEVSGSRIEYIDIPNPIGNCKAFNLGFQKTRGTYIIDLAADDQLLAARVEEGVSDFQKNGEPVAVHFSDAFICNEHMDILHTHFRRSSHGEIMSAVPNGDVFIPVIKKYFICPPTMMIHRAVLEKLKGYDESLSYEDFDFWIRSAREFPYLFNKAPLVKKRTVKDSHSSSQFKLRNTHQVTTLSVCRKAFDLCRSPAEFLALRNRSFREVANCVRTLNLELGWIFFKLALSCQHRLSSFST